MNPVRDVVSMIALVGLSLQFSAVYKHESSVTEILCKERRRRMSYWCWTM